MARAPCQRGQRGSGWGAAAAVHPQHGAALGLQQRASRRRWARQRSLWPGSL